MILCRNPACRSEGANRLLWRLPLILGLMACEYGYAQSVSTSRGLSFGSMVAGAMSGWVTIDSSGNRSCGGGATCISQSAGSSAAFTVSGNALTNYIVTLPVSITLSTSNNSIVVDNFKDSVDGSGTLGVTGTGSFSVGATLNVGAGQPAGSYTGAFDVFVEYQ